MALVAVELRHGAGVTVTTSVARLASANGGEVEVHSFMLDDGRMQVNVSDHGVGIPKDKIKRAMEPFGQVFDQSENAKQQGTGLGLPLAKAMVELHDGTLTISSNVGSGTAVIVRLPRERVLRGNLRLAATSG